MTGPHISIEADRFTQLTDVSVDAAYALLGSSRTRTTLHVLSRCQSEVRLDDLATAVARLQAERSPSSVRISLLHVVLPRLEDHGVLEYELRSETLQLDGPIVALEEPLGTRPDRAERLEGLEQRDRSR